MSRFDDRGATGRAFGRNEPERSQASSDLFAEPSERELAEAAIYLAMAGDGERFPMGLRSQIEQAVLERWNE